MNLQKHHKDAHPNWRAAVHAGRHPEELCMRCGGKNVRAWFAPSNLWNRVMRATKYEVNWNIICPQCFTELAVEVLGETSWELRSENLKPNFAVPSGFVLLSIGSSRIIIDVDKIVAACEVPNQGCDVYTNEPAEANAHFRVDETLEAVSKQITAARTFVVSE